MSIFLKISLLQNMPFLKKAQLKQEKNFFYFL